MGMLIAFRAVQGAGGGGLMVLTRLARQGATHGLELARQAGVTVEEGHPVAELLVGRGLFIRSDGVLALTSAGEQCAAKLFAAQRDWLEHQLAGWSPEQHAELDPILTKLSRAVLGDDAERHLVDT